MNPKQCDKEGDQITEKINRSHSSCFNSHTASGRLEPDTGWIRASEVPFYFQTNPLDARSRITCEPIDGVEAAFPEAVTIYDHNFKKKVDSLLNSFTASCLYPQCNFVSFFERILKRNQMHEAFSNPSGNRANAAQ